MKKMGGYGCVLGQPPRDILANVVAAGNPCKVIKKIKIWN